MAFLRLALTVLILTTGVAHRAAAGDDARLWNALASGGHMALMRHATAPGHGDPAGFTIGDCATQRNLSEEGRAQAKRMGEALRKNGITGVRVYSSQWCRCEETAALLGLGRVEPLPALNSLHGRPQLADAQAAAFREFLDTLPGNSASVVVVSHHATILRFAGVGIASGAMVVAKRNSTGGLEVLGTLPAP